MKKRKLADLSEFQKESQSQSMQYPGTPVRQYGPTRKDFKNNHLVTKDQLRRALATKTELKFFDTNPSATSITTAAVIFSLSDVTQGVTDNTRVGDTLLPKRLYIKMNFVGADVPANIMRVVIFRWNMSTVSDVPGLSEILESTAQPVLAPFAQDNRQRFTMLYDRTWVLNPNAASQTNSIVAMKTLKLAKKPIQFNAGTVDGMFKIYALFVSDSGAITHPTVAFSSRLNYTDS